MAPWRGEQRICFSPISLSTPSLWVIHAFTGKNFLPSPLLPPPPPSLPLSSPHPTSLLSSPPFPLTPFFLHLHSFTALDLAMLNVHASCVAYLVSVQAPTGAGMYHRAALTIQTAWKFHRHKVSHCYHGNSNMDHDFWNNLSVSNINILVSVAGELQGSGLQW